MKRPILAAVAISLASIAAAEQPIVRSDTANSAVEARLDALEKINVTAYKAPQAADVKDAGVDAILAKAAQAEQTANAAE